MARLYEAGWSLRAIGREFHYGHVTVRRLLLAEGVKLRPRGGAQRRLAHREFERTVFLRRRGLTLSQVGSLVGCAESTVCERLRTAGAR